MEMTVGNELFCNEAESCREFSSKLYKAITSDADIDGNMIISPLSVHTVLSYLAHGADGDTASEMIDGLCIKDIKQHHIGYKNLLSTLTSVNGSELRIANAVFLHDNVELLTIFSKLGNEYYNFTVPNINFNNSDESAKIINNWTMDKTNNKIIDIVQSSDITDDTRAIIINAVYFKGPWKYPFNNQQTENKLFHISDTVRKQVPTMRNKNYYSCGELPNIKFIEIPYTDENLSMMIILPDPTYNLSSLEENFNWNTIVNAKTRKREIILHLPKFKIECNLNLKATLRKMGIQSMFENIADFSGMTDTPIKVSKIIQKAFIEVNEEGSEAAAATAIQMRLKRALELPDEFIIDRPFMIIIRHKLSDIPLFLGSVRDIGIIINKDEL